MSVYVTRIALNFVTLRHELTVSAFHWSSPWVAMRYSLLSDDLYRRDVVPSRVLLKRTFEERTLYARANLISLALFYFTLAREAKGLASSETQSDTESHKTFYIPACPTRNRANERTETPG